MTDRREFLIGSLAVAGLAGCAGLAGGKDGKGRLLFGACRSSIEDVTIMRDLGYDFWEWGAGPAFGPDKDEAWWRKQKEEIAKRPLPLRSSNGLLLWSHRITGPKANPGPALDYAEIALRRADEVGVKTVVFGSGGARNVPGDFTASSALVKRVADLKTTQLVIEPLRPKESNIINYVFQGLAICREVNSPRLMQLADIFHMMMGGDSPHAIITAGELLKHVHIAEYGSRLFPGHDPALVGRLWPFFAALRMAGYAGGVSCECGWGDAKDFAKNAKTAIETMKGLL